MLQTPSRPSPARDLAATRRRLAEIREIADSAVQHEINRIEAAFSGTLEHERRRLIAHATKPHRLREDAALRELVAGLSTRERRELFDEILDPRLLAD